MKIKDSIKSSTQYCGKLLHPQATINNALIALGQLNPPISIKLKRIDDCDKLTVPVYVCEPNLEAQKFYASNRAFCRKTYGKGASPMLSKASALMEFVERFSCDTFFKNNKNFRIIPGAQVKDCQVQKIIPLALSNRYRNDDFVSNELKRAPVRWAKVFSLTNNKKVLFPLDWFAYLSSNGYAAGNCREEAILQGLCEVIERHVVSTIIENKIATPSIDVRSIDNDQVKEIISKFHRENIQLFIKDFSCELEIPTVGILAYDPKGPKNVRIYCAAGTSLNKNIALMRALTELAQHRSQSLYAKSGYPANTVRFRDYKTLHEARRLIESKRIMKFSDIPSFTDRNFKVEVQEALKRLKVKGFEVIAADATHPVLKIPTVIVVVPGDYRSGSIAVPNAGNPYFKLHEDYLQAGRYNKAVSVLDRFIKFYPSSKNKKRLMECGLRTEGLKEYIVAVQIYKRVLLLCGKQDKNLLREAYKALARCHAFLGKKGETIDFYKKFDKLL